MKQFCLILMVGAACTFLSAGCGKDPLSSGTTTMTLRVQAVSGSLQKKAGAQAPPVTITSAKLVLDDIEFESIAGDSSDFDAPAPLVVDLNLNGTITTIGTVPIPAGTYDEMEIEFERLQTVDGQVYQNNPNLQNRSIYIRGYVGNDTNAVFVFTSALEEELEQDFYPPLIVDANSPTTYVMLTIDVSTWFNDGAGGYLDPLNPQNQSAIERNIKASLNAWEDDDGDGAIDADDADDGDTDDGDDGDADDADDAGLR